MNQHEQAVSTMAVERYLLNEMPDDERETFEEHFFDCRFCGPAVHAGTMLLENGGELVRAERRFQPGRVMTWLPAAVAAGLLVVIGAQSVMIFNLRRQPAPTAAFEVPQAYSLGQSRAAEERLHAGQPAVLYADIPDQSYPSYRFELRDGSGRIRGAQNVTAKQAKETVPVVLRPLPAGSYVLVIEGVREDGNRTEITRYPVIIRGS
jgi:hypothetical protein